MQTSAIIKALREEYSLRELQEITGISRPTLIGISQGKSAGSIETRTKLQAALASIQPSEEEEEEEEQELAPIARRKDIPPSYFEHRGRVYPGHSSDDLPGEEEEDEEEWDTPGVQVSEYAPPFSILAASFKERALLALPAPQAIPDHCLCCLACGRIVKTAEWKEASPDEIYQVTGNWPGKNVDFHAACFTIWRQKLLEQRAAASLPPIIEAPRAQEVSYQPYGTGGFYVELMKKLAENKRNAQ